MFRVVGVYVVKRDVYAIEVARIMKCLVEVYLNGFDDGSLDRSCVCDGLAFAITLLLKVPP